MSGSEQRQAGGGEVASSGCGQSWLAGAGPLTQHQRGVGITPAPT